MIAVAFLVAAGAGALARAAAGRALNRTLPWGTYAVNASGSLALGLLATAQARVATVVGTGLLGAYTTFSTFARDTVALWEQGRRLLAVLYVAGSVATCVAAAWLGVMLVD